jgi:hypothetical protein
MIRIHGNRWIFGWMDSQRSKKKQSTSFLHSYRRYEEHDHEQLRLRFQPNNMYFFCAVLVLVVDREQRPPSVVRFNAREALRWNVHDRGNRLEKRRKLEASALHLAAWLASFSDRNGRHSIDRNGDGGRALPFLGQAHAVL